jgi:hypothetical protein
MQRLGICLGAFFAIAMIVVVLAALAMLGFRPLFVAYAIAYIGIFVVMPAAVLASTLLFRSIAAGLLEPAPRRVSVFIALSSFFAVSIFCVGYLMVAGNL